MKLAIRYQVKFYLFLSFVLLTLGSSFAAAEDMSALDNDVHKAIATLKATVPAAAKLGADAKGVLIFPNVVKAGFIIGAQYGNGALVKKKAGGGYYIDEYFNLTSASYGFQAGIQSFGYALILMSDAAVQHIETSSGWELGVGPSIVVVDAGMAKTMTTTTADADIYAFTFGQQGMMAGMGLQGSKITPLNK